MSKLVSVVLTTFDDDARLAITLAGWAEQTHKNIQLIVVDDGGSDMDATQKLVTGFENRFTHVNYVYMGPSKKELGKQVFRLSAARNKGLKRAVGEITIISDCDTVPTTTVAESMLEKQTGYRVLVGTRRRIPIHIASTITPPDKDIAHHLAKYTTLDDERLRPGYPGKHDFIHMKDVTKGIHMVWGCLFSAPTKIFKAIGGFDERFIGWGGEDEDMAERLVASGLKLYSVFDCWVYHLDHPPRDPHPYTANNTLQKIRENFTIIRNGGPIE